MADVEATKEYAYQLVGFLFRVSFIDLDGGKVDVSFQSVTGLEVQVDTESLREGGENRFEHTLPARRKYGTLVLKRGLLTPNQSPLIQWCQDAFQKLHIRPLQTVIVELLDENHKPLLKWTLDWVWPKSWKIAEFNAERSEVLIETFDLNYNHFKLEKA